MGGRRHVLQPGGIPSGRGATLGMILFFLKWEAVGCYLVADGFQIEYFSTLHQINQTSYDMPGSRVAIWKMVIPPSTGNPYIGYVNPYYWVDDHPLYGTNRSLEPQHIWCQSARNDSPSRIAVACPMVLWSFPKKGCFQKAWDNLGPSPQ